MLPQQPIPEKSSRRVKLESVSWESLCEIDAEPNDLGHVESLLIGDLQAEHILSLFTPEQREVAELLVTGLPPIEVAKKRGTRRLATHRMIKRMRSTLRVHYADRIAFYERRRRKT